MILRFLHVLRHFLFTVFVLGVPRNYIFEIWSKIWKWFRQPERQLEDNPRQIRDPNMKSSVRRTYSSHVIPFWRRVLYRKMHKFALRLFREGILQLFTNTATAMIFDTWSIQYKMRSNRSHPVKAPNICACHEMFKISIIKCVREWKCNSRIAHALVTSRPPKRNKSAKPKCACSQNLFSNIIATSLNIALATELFFCSRPYILRYILLFSTPPLSRLLSCLVFSGLVVFSTCPYCFLFSLLYPSHLCPFLLFRLILSFQSSEKFHPTFLWFVLLRFRSGAPSPVQQQQ